MIKAFLIKIGVCKLPKVVVPDLLVVPLMTGLAKIQLKHKQSFELFGGL
jgi:hypothetical protein